MDSIMYAACRFIMPPRRRHRRADERAREADAARLGQRPAQGAAAMGQLGVCHRRRHAELPRVTAGRPRGVSRDTVTVYACAV